MDAPKQSWAFEKAKDRRLPANERGRAAGAGTSIRRRVRCACPLTPAKSALLRIQFLHAATALEATLPSARPLSKSLLSPAGCCTLPATCVRPAWPPSSARVAAAL